MAVSVGMRMATQVRRDAYPQSRVVLRQNEGGKQKPILWQAMELKLPHFHFFYSIQNLV